MDANTSPQQQMNDLSPDEQRLLTAAVMARELKNKGHDNAFISDKIVELGVDRDTANGLLNAMANHSNEARRSAGRRNMLFGALWCIGGIVVTVMTYSAAQGGGRYVIAYGAIIVGFIQFIKGATQASG